MFSSLPSCSCRPSALTSLNPLPPCVFPTGLHGLLQLGHGRISLSGARLGLLSYLQCPLLGLPHRFRSLLAHASLRRRRPPICFFRTRIGRRHFGTLGVELPVSRGEVRLGFGEAELEASALLDCCDVRSVGLCEEAERGGGEDQRTE